MITLKHDFEPNTLIESMITFVQEALKTEHSVDNVATIRMIYRGFILDPAKSVSEVSSIQFNQVQCTLNPEYPLIAIVQCNVASTNTSIPFSSVSFSRIHCTDLEMRCLRSALSLAGPPRPAASLIRHTVYNSLPIT